MGEHSAVFYKNKVYIYGGRGVNFDDVYGDLWAFDFGTNEWSDLTAGNALSSDRPPAMFGHSAVVYGGKMILFGGYSAAAFACISDVYEYDFETRIFSKHDVAGTAPLPRYGHTARVYTNKMNVLNGASDSFEEFNTWWQYDLDTQTWDLMYGSDQSASAGRYSHAVAIVGDNMVMYGGQGNRRFYDDLRAYPLINVGQY